MRIFAPLDLKHPLVTNGDNCALCHRRFWQGQRTTLLAPDVPGRAQAVRAVPVHATCALQDVIVHRADGSEIVIERIKDGDGSPYPVVGRDLESGRPGQWKLEEVGLA